MPISAVERATAKKAYGEMRSCDMTRTSVVFSLCLYLLFILLFGILVASGMHVDDYGKDLRGWDAYFCFLSFVFRHFWWVLLILASQFRTYRRLQPRYAENLKVVIELEQKHAKELPYGLEPEIERTEHVERRPLLWRLDAFLSRKQIEK